MSHQKYVEYSFDCDSLKRWSEFFWRCHAKNMMRNLWMMSHQKYEEEDCRKQKAPRGVSLWSVLIFLPLFSHLWQCISSLIFLKFLSHMKPYFLNRCSPTVFQSCSPLFSSIAFTLFTTSIVTGFPQTVFLQDSIISSAFSSQGPWKYSLELQDKCLWNLKSSLTDGLLTRPPY